jgi:pseudouridine synthase
VENKDKDVLQKTVRINRFLAMSGIASRRAAEDVVLAGEVRVNGQVVESLGTQVDPDKDTVTVRGKRVSVAEHMVYILLNKPKDYITTAKDEQERRTVYDLLSVKERVFPIGRLDRNTTGVLLFTNDGFLASKLMHPSSEVKKEYHVSIDHSLDESHRDKLMKGIYLDDGKTAPAEITLIPGTKNKEVVVTIHEGRNRQVRRMFETLGYEIIRLHRVSYGGVTADGLARGKWRFLTDQEVRKLKGLVGTKDESTRPGGRRGRSTRPKFKTADKKFQATDSAFDLSATSETPSNTTRARSGETVRPSKPEFKSIGGKFKSAGPKFKSTRGKFKSDGTEFKSMGGKFKSSGTEFKSAGPESRSASKKFSPSGAKFKSPGAKFKSSGTASKPTESKTYTVDTKSKTMRHRKAPRSVH